MCDFVQITNAVRTFLQYEVWVLGFRDYSHSNSLPPGIFYDKSSQSFKHLIIEIDDIKNVPNGSKILTLKQKEKKKRFKRPIT